MGFDVRANEITKFANYVQLEVVNDLRGIGRDLENHGLSTEGITGLIEEAITPFMTAARNEIHTIFENGYVDQAVDLFVALKANATEYGAIDEEAERRFEKEYAERQHGDKKATGNKRYPRM